MKHTILFLAANPSETDRLALDREARAIQAELEHSCHRDRFAFETRWAAEPMDLLRELRKLKPTVVHFSGHGGQQGLCFQDLDGRPRVVSSSALATAFGAAGSSVKLVVLNACYTEPHADALLAHVGCVVGTNGPLPDTAARSFAIGFYGGLGERESVAAAYKQGCAAISLESTPGDAVGEGEGPAPELRKAGPRPQLKVCAGVDADCLVLADSPTGPSPPARARLIDFTVERQRHLRFLGREDVLDCLDEWLLGPAEAGWVMVTGGPGMGKSAILSAWLVRRESAGIAVPHHFIRRQVADWDQPEIIAVSLAAQIEEAFPELCDPEAKPERRLLELLGRVSKRLSSSAPLVVVVDGLDETRAEPGDNPLPRFLPHAMPAGIRFLCATRATYPHLSWLEARNSVRRLDLDGARWAASNAEVVCGFWQAVAREYEPPLPTGMVAAAIARADGNVLHAVMLHDALRDLPAAERGADWIPRGLRALLGEIWSRAASRDSVRAGLGLLCAAQEALSLDAIADLAGWGHEEREQFLCEARQLLLEEPAAWAGFEAYRPRHDWVRELITERLGAAAIRGHHETLSRKLATWPPADAAWRQYAVRHALAQPSMTGTCAVTPDGRRAVSGSVDLTLKVWDLDAAV